MFMGRVIVKTVVLTLMSFFAVFFLGYGSFAVSSPKSLAKAWSNMGNYDLSIKYYEKQYEKSENISDLTVLCDKLNEKEDSARSVKYLELLTQDEGFAAFCTEQDVSGGYDFTAYEFYYGKYASAICFNSGINDAVSVAKKSVQSGGYTKYNAFYILLGVETLTAADGAVIKDVITQLEPGLSTSEQAFASRDVAIADSIK